MNGAAAKWRGGGVAYNDGSGVKIEVARSENDELINMRAPLRAANKQRRCCSRRSLASAQQHQRRMRAGAAFAPLLARSA